MQKWDYLLVLGLYNYQRAKTNFPKAYRITSKGFELVSDFKDRPNNISEEAAVGQFIAQLGEDGWEMTGAGNTNPSVHCLYFKRAKE